MNALFIALTLLSASYREPSLSKYETYRVGSPTGAVCAGYYGRENKPRREAGDYIGRDVCFDTRRECEAWFYAVQTYFRDVQIRRPCR